jgi:hypothetical protein
MPRKASPVRTFILSQPRDSRAADVVAAAKRAGLTTSAAYVYIVRSRHGGERAPTRSVAGAPERQLIDAALGIGITRAESLLRAIRTRAHALA